LAEANGVPEADVAAMDDGINAACMKLCGHCVGTDKIGHFIEEGLMYAIVQSQKRDKKFALALGYWLEGMTPPGYHKDPDLQSFLAEGAFMFISPTGHERLAIADKWAYFQDRGLDPNGGASPADIAANEGGLQFYDELSDWIQGDKGEPFDFDICRYVNEKWDHTKNPNVKVGEQPVPRP